MSNGIKILGEIEIIRYNIDGSIDGKFNYRNLVTDIGIDFIRRIIGGDRPAINRIALGSGINPVSKTDTQLNNKLILVNANRDYSVPNKINFLGVVQENTFNNTVFYTEGGLVYRGSGNEEVLITRSLFPDVVYQKPQNSLSISYTLTLS